MNIKNYILKNRRVMFQQAKNLVISCYINYFGTNLQSRALNAKEVTPTQALQFTDLNQVLALETEKVTPEQALDFTSIVQVWALLTRQMTPEQALQFTDLNQVLALQTVQVTFKEAPKFNDNALIAYFDNADNAEEHTRSQDLTPNTDMTGDNLPTENL